MQSIGRSRRVVPGCRALVVPLGVLAITVVLALTPRVCRAADELSVGFATADITPDLSQDEPVYIAGYGMNRTATGVHDPLSVRACSIRVGERTLAFVAVDLVGLQLPAVDRIRATLKQQQVPVDYVLVTSTHNHEAPDVIGIWGRSPTERGVSKDYLARVEKQCVTAVTQSLATLTKARASFGTAEDESLLRDSRLPIVKDATLRLLQFHAVDDARPLGCLMQWSCHPEALGSKNRLITADYPAATIEHFEQQTGMQVVFFTGAIGGLMAPPREGRIRDDEGQPLGEGDFEYARRYGVAVSELAQRAAADGVPLTLSPLRVGSKRIAVPIQNPWYRAARVAGVLQRTGHRWTGDFRDLGPPLNGVRGLAATAVESEVVYLRLGELHLAGIPGEIYPELVYGKVQDPADPHADYPDAAAEEALVDILPGDHWMLVGLCNDELGYILPRRQWDREAPYAYGRSEPAYGEINSCGPQMGPLITQAFRWAVESVTPSRGGTEDGGKRETEGGR